MRFVSLALTCVLTTCTIASAASHSAAGEKSFQRIRPLQPRGHEIVNEGLLKSPTFRRLVDRLRSSDVIVYVDVRADVPPHLGGALTFVGQSATDRYLRVTINSQNHFSMLVALLGHELQHAVEVADHSDVNSAGQLRALYQRIGVRMSRNAYDSRAAQDTGQIVRAELRGDHSDTRLARHAQAAHDPLLAGGSITEQ